MSAIACPECNKRISSHSSICRFCGHRFGEVSPEDIALYEARRMRDRIYRLNMVSYLVIAFLLAGFAWFWWDTAGFSRMPGAGPLVFTGIAALCYVVVRGLLFRVRKQRRAIQQTRDMSRSLRKKL